MKKILFVAFMLLGINAYSQTEQADLYLEYAVIQNGKQKVGKFYKIKNEGLYFYENSDSSHVKETQEDNAYGTVYSVELKSSHEVHGMVKTNLDSEELLSSERIFNKGEYREFVVKEKLSNIDWKLLTDSKEIAGFKCRKATANFKGRNYEVWYTIEIPILMGPWKLHGLPGAIVEAYDIDNYIHFSLAKVSTDKQSIAHEELNEDNAISCAEYLALKADQGLEMSKHIQSKLPRGAQFNVTKTTNNWLEKDCN
ncbi:GLPGLI family protein [Pontibacter sp. H249]|uniref:GLPGLI family protein n=1 Tax=Pontibacter sp. H249 TaxID=3133420 RepID=UPI0030BB6AED